MKNGNVDLIKLQNHTLFALQAFSDFAEEHNLKYSLAFGTLLGAIRHKGFIPWDDDVDVVMPRDDYDRFLELSDNNFSKEFFVQNHLTDKENFHFFTRICIEDTLAIQKLYKHIDNHKGIFIDIFPLDHIAPEEEQKKHLRKLLFLKRLKRIPNENPRIHDRLFSFIARIFPNSLSFQNINKKMDKVAQKYNHIDSGFLYTSGDATGLTSAGEYFYGRYKIPIKSFDNLIDHQFEKNSFPVFSNYDEILRLQYGDYMQLPSIGEQIPHHGFEQFKFREDLV